MNIRNRMDATSMTFDTSRNRFERDYELQKKKRDLAFQQKATGQKRPISSASTLETENRNLRKALEIEKEKLAKVKGIAVHMHNIAGRVNSASPKEILDWADTIINHINGKPKKR